MQLARTLQSYKEPDVNPLKLTDSDVVAVAALIQVPDEFSL